MVSKNMIKKSKYLLIPVFLAFAYLYQSQDDLVFSPQKMNFADRESYSEHEIAVFRGNETLHGWFINRSEIKNTPLLVIYGDSDQEISQYLQHVEKMNGISALLVNYRGYGESSGEPTQNYLIGDALDILDQITADNNIEFKDVVIYGHGLGTGVATVMAHYRNIGSLILSSPFNSMVSVVEDQHPYLPVRHILKHHFSSIDLAPTLDLPTAALIADEDELYRPKFAEKLLSRWKGEVTKINYSSDRKQMQENDKYWDDISGFIAEWQNQSKLISTTIESKSNDSDPIDSPIGSGSPEVKKEIEKESFQKEIKIIYAAKEN